MSIELNMFQGHMMTAKDDAVVYEPMMTGNGILHGCEITFLGANQVHIEAGDGIIKGRKFTILEETINVQLPEEDGLPGRIYIRMDLSDTEEPIKIISTCHSTTLPDLEQDEECNYTNGVYEIELATYTGNRTAITDLISTYTVVSGMWKQIKKDVEETNNSLGKVKFGIDGDGNRGYYGADGSLIPFKRNIELLGKTLPISLVSTRVDGGSIDTYVDFIPCGDFLKINASRGYDKSLLELYGKINVSDNSYTRIWSSDISNSNINQMCNIKGYKILRIVCSDKKDQYAGVWTSSIINGSLVFS